MITKAIVETVINPYSAKVRIPFYNKAANNPTATATENLCIATICTIPNSTMNYAPGDVVFIGFEDNLTSQPIILGQLCRETKTDRNAFIKAATLEVNTDAYLPINTSIGDIKPEEIRYLNGVTDNIQHQLDLLQEIKTSFFIQSYMPVNPYPGDIWIPSENYVGLDGRLYIKDHMYRYSMEHEWLDVSTSAQAQLAIVIKELEAINSNLSGNVNYTISATEPEYKKVGDIWKDISTNPPIYKRYVCIDPENEIYDWVGISEEEAENRLTINTIKLTADSLETLIRNEINDRQTAIIQTEDLISFEAQAREVADNDLIQDYSAKFQITADTISQEVENRINEDAVLRTSIETTAEGLSAEVTNRINGDTALQTNLDITAGEIRTELTNTASGLQTQITANTEGIATKVEKNGVISAINQSAEEIKIEASKVNVTGFVTFENLSGSGTTVINGDNITTGRISAQYIETPVITADDIYAGKLHGREKSHSVGIDGSLTVYNGNNLEGYLGGYYLSPSSNGVWLANSTEENTVEVSNDNANMSYVPASGGSITDASVQVGDFGVYLLCEGGNSADINIEADNDIILKAGNDIKLSRGSVILNNWVYGPTLPASGTQGQLFFKI